MVSMRKIIGQGLVAMLQGINDPDTSQPLLQYVKLGNIFDPSEFTGLWGEVVYAHGNSGPAGSGGNQIGWRIEDDMVFGIMLGCDYDADSTAAMNTMLHAMDVLLPVIHSRYQIPAPGNPSQPIATVYSMLSDDQNDAGQPVQFPNGRVYYQWATYVQVKQQYNVTLTP